MGKRPSRWPDHWGVDELLDRYPGLALRPTKERGTLVIGGELQFSATGGKGGVCVTDSFSVEITVPSTFPAEPPVARETAGRVPKTFHTNPDGTLCLGSPLRLQMEVRRKPSLLGFVDRCLIPYLYGYAHHERGAALPFGELDHGSPGLLFEYRHLLGVKDNRTCVGLLSLVGEKKRIANKRPCPCGSGRRVGRCHHRKLNRLRMSAPRHWFRRHAATLARSIR